MPFVVWRIVVGDGAEVGNAVTDNVDYVAFTGSTATGRLVAQRAAARLIGCSLELGGKNPAIVLPSANLAKAARQVATGAFGNGGQLCVSLSRIYVPNALKAEFEREFVAVTESLKVGRANDFSFDIGSLTSEAARATVAPYTVAKGGIKMLSKAMAAEWAQHNIQANSIGPGYILTDMNEALVNNPSFDAWVKSSNPAQRWGRPDELVGTAIYLASGASNYVNGQIIYVDGGWLSVL